MKRKVIIMLAVCLCLAGCAAPPSAAADGTAWSEDWIVVGNVLGVDTPEGMVLQENNDALAASGMYYAAWSIGKPVPYVNEDGDDAEIYDAQLYLLLAGYDEVGKAEARAAELLDMASAQYRVEDSFTAACNGQTFTVITYTFASETNPYARGASAFGVYGNYTISAELACREDLGGDAREILTDFLEHCHYAA